MSSALARLGDMLPASYDETVRLAEMFAHSGMFTDVKGAAQAVVKIMAGAEMGFPPFASMQGVHIIQGRPSLGANLIAAAIKRSGRYDYRVVRMDNDACILQFYENGQPVGESPFTRADAIKAQTKNLDKFPRNMLFARAISNGARWYCPDVFGGAAIYTPEELGADVDDEGNVIDMPMQEQAPATEPQLRVLPSPSPSAAPTNGNGHAKQEQEPAWVAGFFTEAIALGYKSRDDVVNALRFLGYKTLARENTELMLAALEAREAHAAMEDLEPAF